MVYKKLGWYIGFFCLLAIPGAFLAPALVDYFDTSERKVTDCKVLDTLVHFHKNGCSRCYDDDDCRDYDCFSIEYSVLFMYKDINISGVIEEVDEFDDSQDAHDRIAHDHPIGSTGACVVNPTKKGGYEVRWGDKINNTAWIVLFVFFGLCCCLWLLAAAYISHYEYRSTCGDNGRVSQQTDFSDV